MSSFRMFPLSFDTLKDRLVDRKFAFIAPISFEERSTAGARIFAKNSLRPSQVFLFDYSTYVEPPEEDREMRRRCRKDFSKFFGIGDLGCSVHEHINAFAFNSLFELCTNFLARFSKLPQVIDITCMTRVHLVALSSALTTSVEHKNEVYFCYTTPSAYGFQHGVFQGWRDTIIVPIGKRGFFKREGHSRGIIFAGSYGERLSVALQEWEPASGILIYAREEGRPDLLRKAKDVNKFIENRLSLLRMPGKENDRIMEDSWRISVVGLDDLSHLTAIISKETEIAIRNGGPIVMYPFGPKVHTLSAGVLLASLHEMQSWVVYPIPEKFDAGYSVGISSFHVYGLIKQGRVKSKSI